MLDESKGEAEQRVLVVAPTTRDGEVTRALLAQAGVRAVVCPDLTHLCREMAVGAGTLSLPTFRLLLSCLEEKKSVVLLALRRRFSLRSCGETATG